MICSAKDDMPGGGGGGGSLSNINAVLHTVYNRLCKAPM